MPTFTQVRSMLLLEETSKAERAKSEAANNTAMLMYTTTPSVLPKDSSPPRSSNSRGKRQQGKQRGGNQRGNQFNSNYGNGRRTPRNSQQYYSPQQPSFMPLYGWQFPPWFGWYSQPQQWMRPPCTYPTTPWSPRPQRTPQQGVLGAHPFQQQSFYTATTSPSTDYAPTEIEQAIHTLSLKPPEEQWYMDSAATSHMTANPGMLTSYSKLSQKKGIVVGNGHLITIQGRGNVQFQQFNPFLNLRNVLYAPQMIKNLISVRKFTADNWVSVEFDPFGFSVKVFLMGNQILRCESSGELYPFTIPSSRLESSCVAVSPNL